MCIQLPTHLTVRLHPSAGGDGQGGRGVGELLVREG